MNSVMRQKEFLTSILDGLKSRNSTREMLIHLNRLRAILVSTSNIAVHVTADLTELQKMKIDLNVIWQRFKVPYYQNVAKKYLNKKEFQLKFAVLINHSNFN